MAEVEEKFKRKLEPTVLDNFTKLTNGQEGIRTKAGVNLIKYWLQCDSNENGENEVNYALARLVRGLGSSKCQARYGFYSTLTALLSLKDDLKVDQLLEHVDKQLKKAGSNSKSENADICAGQIELCCSVVRSGLFSRSSDDDKKKILDMLILAGKQRSYLKLAAYNVISELIEKLNEKEFEKIVFPCIKDELSKPWSEQTIDNLYLMLTLQNKYEGVLKVKFLQRFLGTPEIICAESLGHLASILMSIPKIDYLKHPVYRTVANAIANTEYLPPCMDEINKHLHRPNRNKFLTATKLISEVLEVLEHPESVPLLFPDNYIVQLLGSFRSIQGRHKDNELQQNVHKLFTQLVEKLKPPEIGHKAKISILKKFLFYPGTFIFEKVTRSKVVQHITSDLNAEGVKKLAKLYREVILAEKHKPSDENKMENWLNNDRLYAAHLLVKLLNHPAMNSDNEWKIAQLKFLIQLGLIKDEDHRNVGCELAASLKETFFRALDMKHSKLEDTCNILSALVQEFDSLINENNLDTILRNPIKPEDYELWQKMTQIATKIGNKKKKDSGLNVVFRTLFLHMGLQLFNDVKLANDSLKELFICYERTRRHKSNSEENEESEDPLWIEVVTDLFLNLLSHSSHLLRTVINSVFPHLCKYMNAAAVHQILSVLDLKNENPLSNKDGESDDSDEEDEDHQSDNGEENGDEEDLDEDEEDEDIDDADEDETVNDKLKMALHQVFINNSKDFDQESIDLDELSDTEGEKLNEALGEAFKQFKPNLGKKSNKQSKSDETLTHFRVRVLDLVQIYLDSEPSMLLTLEIMLPLLQALEFSVRNSHQKPLEERLRSCLKKLSGIKKFSTLEDVNETLLSDLLNSLLEKGTKNALLVQEMGNEIAECCIFIIRCSQLLISHEETPKKTKKHIRKNLRAIMENALDLYFKKRDCLTPYVLFKNLLQLNWDGNLNLIALLMNFCFDEQIRPFRKSQALELIRLFMLNHRYISSDTEKISNFLDESLRNFHQNTIGLLEALSENPSEHKIKEKYITNLFSAWTSIKNSPLKSLDLDWKKLGETVREFRSNVTFSNDAKSAYNKLCSCLSVSNAVEMKPKPIRLSNMQKDDNESIVSSNKEERNSEKKKQKKMKKNEKLKLKKQSQEIRLKALSEGLEENAFSCVGNVEVEEMLKHGMETDEENECEEKHSSPKPLKRKRNNEKSNSSEETDNVKIKKKKKKLNGNI